MRAAWARLPACDFKERDLSDFEGEGLLRFDFVSKDAGHRIRRESGSQNGVSRMQFFRGEKVRIEGKSMIQQRYTVVYAEILRRRSVP